MALASLDALTSFGLSSSGHLTVGRLRRAAGWRDPESDAPPVVGLEKQTEELLNFMRGVAHGQENNSVLIVGDSGTGKETLVQRALARLAVEQAESSKQHRPVSSSSAAASASTAQVPPLTKASARLTSLDSRVADFDVVFLSGDHLKDDCDAVRSISAQLSLDVGQAAMARALGGAHTAPVTEAEAAEEAGALASGKNGSGGVQLLTPPRTGAETVSGQTQAAVRDRPTQEIHKPKKDAQGQGAASVSGSAAHTPPRARGRAGAGKAAEASPQPVPGPPPPSTAAAAGARTTKVDGALAPKPSLLELHRQAQLARLQIQAECGLLPSQQPKSDRGRPPTKPASARSEPGPGTGPGAGKKRPREASPSTSAAADAGADMDDAEDNSSEEEEQAAGESGKGGASSSTSLHDLWLKLRASKMSTPSSSSSTPGKGIDKDAAQERKRISKLIKQAARVNPCIIQTLRAVHGVGPEGDLAVYNRLLEMNKRMPTGYTLLGHAALGAACAAVGSSRRSSNASSVASDAELGEDGDEDGKQGQGTGRSKGSRSVVSSPAAGAGLSAQEQKKAAAAVALVVKARRGWGGGAIPSSLISTGSGPIVVSCTSTAGGPMAGSGMSTAQGGMGSSSLSSPVSHGISLSLTLRALPRPHAPQVVQAIINLERLLDQARRMGCSGNGGAVGRRLAAACAHGALLMKRLTKASSTADSRGLAVFRGSKNEQYVKDGYDTIGVYGIDPTSLLQPGAGGSGRREGAGQGGAGSAEHATDARLGISDSLVPKMVPTRRAAAAAAAVLSSSLAGKKSSGTAGRAGSGKAGDGRSGDGGMEGGGGKADREAHGGTSTTYVAGNYEVHLDFVLQALQSGGSHARPVFIIIRGFEAFARKTRQTLLYSLLDLTQSPKVRLSIIGLTSNVDTVDMLEKRLKSRFSSRLLFTRPPTLPRHVLSIACTAWAGVLAQCGLEGAQAQTLMSSEQWTSAAEELFAHAGLQGLLETCLAQGQRYAWYAAWLAQALPAPGTVQPWKADGKPNGCALPSLHRLCHPQVLTAFCAELVPFLSSVARMSLATLAAVAEEEVCLLERGVEPRKDAFSLGSSDNAVARLAKAGFAPSALRSVPAPVLAAFKLMTSAECLILCAAIAVHRRDNDSDGTSVLALAHAVGAGGRGGKGAGAGGARGHGGASKLNFARVYAELQAQSKALALGGTGAGSGQLAHGVATVTGTVLAAASSSSAQGVGQGLVSSGSGSSSGGTHAHGPVIKAGPLALSDITALDAWEGLLQKDLLRFLYPSVVALTASSGGPVGEGGGAGGTGKGGRQSNKALEAYPALSQSTYTAAPGLDSIEPVLSRAAATELLPRHEGLRWAAVGLACDPAHVTLILETAAASVAADPLLPLTAYDWSLPVLQTSSAKVLTSTFDAPGVAPLPTTGTGTGPDYSHLVPRTADALAWSSHLCPAAVTVGEKLTKWMISAASGQV